MNRCAALLVMARHVAGSVFPAIETWESFDGSIFKGALGAERIRILKVLVLVVFLVLIAVSLIWISMTLGWIRSKKTLNAKKESMSLVPDKQSFDADTSKAIHEALRKYGAQQARSTWRSSTNWQ